MKHVVHCFSEYGLGSADVGSAARTPFLVARSKHGMQISDKGFPPPLQRLAPPTPPQSPPTRRSVDASMVPPPSLPLSPSASPLSPPTPPPAWLPSLVVQKEKDNAPRGRTGALG